MGTIGYTVHSTRKKFLSWKCSQCNKINMGAVAVFAETYSQGPSKSRANSAIDVAWQFKMLEERFDPGKSILHYRNCRCRYCNNQEFWAKAKKPILLGKVGWMLLIVFAVYWIQAQEYSESAVRTCFFVTVLLLLVSAVYAGYASVNNDKLISEIKKHPDKDLPLASYDLEGMARMTLTRYPRDAEEILEKFKLLPFQEGW